MVCFTGGKQRNKDHREKLTSRLKASKKGLILVVYILSASQLITQIRRGDEFSSCEKSRGE